MADSDNPVPSAGILHKHMGHCPGQLPVLDNRAAAHSLHDTSCQLQQLRIRHLNDHTFVLMAGIIVHLLDLNGVILQLAGNIAADISRSLLYILAAGDFHGFS